MIERKNFTLSEEAVAQLREMSEKDNRSMSNFLDTLIAQEYARRLINTKSNEKKNLSLAQPVAR